MSKYILDEEAKLAIEESIKHWEKDIKKPLENGEVIEMRGKHEYYDGTPYWIAGDEVLMFSDNCPLCSIYFDQDFKRCRVCPYFLKYDHSCDSNKGHWRIFFENPNLENANKMIEALKAILDEE